jgi:hypothetical protein
MMHRLSRVPVLALSLVLLSCASTSGTGPTAPHVVNTITTTGLNQSRQQLTPISIFSLDDTVVCIVDFAWSDVTRSGGDHLAKWRWYREGTLVSQSQSQLTFRTSPFTTWTRRAASSLGPGKYTVETLLDDQVASTCEFQIKAQ